MGSPKMTPEKEIKEGCVLLFVKSPRHEAVKTRLAKGIGKETARELYGNFVLDMLDTLKGVSAGMRCGINICFYPREAEEDVRGWLGDDFKYRPQRGSDLGERMKNAFLESFASGRDRVILLGSDVPDLAGEIIRKAMTCLENADAVVGPSHDGGYYLIGFNVHAFRPSIFEGISWGGAEVFQKTLEIFRREKMTFSVLPLWRDMDTMDDLRDLKRRHLHDGFAASRTMRLILSHDAASANDPAHDDPTPAVQPKQ